MGVPEIMHTDVGEPCGSGKSSIAIRDAAVSQALRAAADAVGGLPAFILLLAGFMFLQDMYERQRHLQIAIGGAIFGWGFDVSTLYLLCDAAAHVEDFSINVGPTQGIDLSLAHPGVKSDIKENIISPVSERAGLGFGNCDVGFELVGGVVAQLVLRLFKIYLRKIPYGV